MYARACSRKVAASCRSKSNEGRHTGNHPLCGCLRDRSGKERWIVDDEAAPYRWRGTTVTYLLGRMEYMGHTVNFKTYKKSYKDKNRRPMPVEKQAVGKAVRGI